jgi:hypothetical protein
MADPYVVLGVARSATRNEIKSAYRRLARKYHPDVNRHPAAARKFALVNEAYHLLIDNERRGIYDRTGATTSTPPAQRRASAAEAAARRAYYQARADRVVNEWLQREREESRARGKAVYTTVTLFLSTFIVALMKPSFFESSTPVWRVALLIVFGVSVWHLVRSLREHFEHYTYRPERLSVTRPTNVTKPFKRSIAWGFVVGGYLFSLTVGMLLSVLTDDLSKQLFGPTSSAESLLGVFFYPPIVVLIVDMIYRVNLHLDDL